MFNFVFFLGCVTGKSVDFFVVLTGCAVATGEKTWRAINFLSLGSVGICMHQCVSDVAAPGVNKKRNVRKHFTASIIGRENMPVLGNNLLELFANRAVSSAAKESVWPGSVG